MEPLPKHPKIYEINTRSWINGLSNNLGRRMTLSTVPQECWKNLKALGMDLVWLMGVWLPSPGSVAIARTHPELKLGYSEVLPDWTPEDVVGSPYAVADYSLNPLLGTDEDLIRLRETLGREGLGLILDFVPNHTALDHPWVAGHPERYVWWESELQLNRSEGFLVQCRDGRNRWVAHGRDPFFPPWTDTAQLCAICSEARTALAGELIRLAHYCDGLRCDMAMLPLNQVFSRTWGAWMEQTGRSAPETEFWRQVLKPLKDTYPEFILIAEAYWGMEPDLLDLGFDYVYDKAGYDHLRRSEMTAYKQGLSHEGARCNRMVRFLENHDEERMATAFPLKGRRSAAVIHATSPGMKLFHHGQLEGLRKKAPVQLGRQPNEPVDGPLRTFYERLLKLTGESLFRKGCWSALSVRAAFEGDEGYRPIVAFAYGWENARAVVAVNQSPEDASGYLLFPEGYWQDRSEIRLLDRLSEPEALYVRERGDLEIRGLYVKLEPYDFHFFEVSS